MKYPIGIQDFEYIRQNNFVYVDKTALVYQLADLGKYYFLTCRSWEILLSQQATEVREVAFAFNF